MVTRKAPAKKAVSRTRGAKPAVASAPAAAPTPDRGPVDSIPEGLGEDGAALWLALAPGPGPERHLALEACRCTDRLAKLDRYLTGADEWLVLVEPVPTVHKIIVDSALSEARQQQLALARLLTTLRALGLKSAVPEPKGSPADELAARRRAEGRQSAAAAQSRPGRK